MLAVLTTTGPWLFLIALTGLVVGAVGNFGDRSRSLTDEDRALAAAWAFCLILVVLRVVDGRPGLWLEIGVVFTGVYVAACALGHGLRGALGLSTSRARDAG